MTEPTIRHFHDELADLRDSLIAMSGLVEDALSDADKVLREYDKETCKKIRRGDRKIDEREVDIEERVTNLMALHQPVASDLRLLLAILKISNDLERVGDHAVNISRGIKRLGMAPTYEKEGLLEMSARAREMVRGTLDAFVSRDSRKSREICASDDVVDKLHKKIYRSVLSDLRSGAPDLEADMEVLLISRNLERVADLATNIAEDTVYLVEGTTIKHNLEDDD